MQTTHQGLLLPALQRIFPGVSIFKKHRINYFFSEYDISINTRKKSSVKDPTTGKWLELDLWIPDYNICFEFQDTYHYVTTWYSHIPLAQTKQRDKVRKKNETIIVVPCWWDGNVESLLASIQFQRPDVISKSSAGHIIPLNPPKDYFNPTEIPDIGELMLASFSTDPKFSESISPQDSWWMGEKYDGVRCCWNSMQAQLYSRSGIPLDIDVFEDVLPASACFDGEIWFGRGFFHYAQRFVQASSDLVDWDLLRIIAFDIPPPTVPSGAVFEDRFKSLLANISYEHPHIITAPRVKCSTTSHLNVTMQNILSHGGEGVILQKPDSLYVPGRTATLLKLKAARGDMEAIIEGVSFKEGYVQLKIPDGKVFQVDRPNIFVILEELRKGDIVTFSYDNYSRRSLPINARIVRVRKDISWEDVLRNNSEPAQKDDFTSQPTGYWTADEGKNVRAFLEELAISRNKDPLDAQTWYSIPRKDIEQEKGGRAILHHFKGGYVQMLMTLFPEIYFEESKFALAYGLSQYSTDVKKRRNWFINFAKEKKFDPLVAANWYHIASEKFLKKAQSVLQYYCGNFVKALAHVFPEIGFEEDRFFPINRWQDPQNRREFFKSFAINEGYDYNEAERWYSVTLSMILGHKGGSGVMYHYSTIGEALIDLFPDLGFEITKFQSVPRSHWEFHSNRRRALEKYAERNSFDPSIHANWFSANSQEYLHTEGNAILEYYNGDVVALLHDLFPGFTTYKELRFNKPQNYWKSRENRRKFFEDYARANGFDPLIPENWYPENNKIKGASGFLIYYNTRSIASALMDLFPEIGLEKDKFQCHSHNHWEDVANRRAFFVDYAKEAGFDPLIPQNWTSACRSQIVHLKGASGVLSYHNGSVFKALTHLFPDIGLDRDDVQVPTSRNYWSDKENRRSFFVKFAHENNFDPAETNRWYGVDRESVLNSKGARGLLAYYNDSIPGALVDLFPKLGLDRTKFNNLSSPRNYWRDQENRKLTLENFALENKFDPLKPENWYTLQKQKLMTIKGIKTGISLHGGSSAKMIVDLFPEAKLDQTKFFYLR